jgi:exosortase E/protease (VPEID-CTERM system)
MNLSETVRGQQSDPTALIRLLLAAVFAVGEILIISLLFDPDWQSRILQKLLYLQYFVRQLALLCITSALAFVIISWPKRHVIVESWLAQVRPGGWHVLLVANIALFVGLAIATVEFSRYTSAVDQPPWGLYSAYLVLLAATGLSLILLVAPFSFWRQLLSHHRLQIAMAVVAGLIATLAGVLTQSGWGGLANVTLRVSYRLLSLYESDARVDYDKLSLGVGDFTAYIDKSCSGYEGMGLVTAFLSLFLWVFRRSLLFPNALALIPIGVGAIWLLNSARIAALVSLGAHVSPEVAISGFHSQAGWIAFLFVAIGIMATAPRLAVFGTNRENITDYWSPNDRLILAFLAPFMSLMAANIIVAAFAPYDAWLYGLKVAFIGVCLWLFRDVYLGLMAKVEPVALACGGVVGALWVVTGPATGQNSGIGDWIVAQPVWLAAVWLTIRAIGSIVMVPIAEELAFRGLLYRWLISRRFETVSFSQFSWLAFILSSLLFGLMHQRWIEGALTGAVFALLMYRSGRLAEPIGAHMTANAVIVAWAIASRNWSLL